MTSVLMPTQHHCNDDSEITRIGRAVELSRSGVPCGWAQEQHAAAEKAAAEEAARQTAEAAAAEAAAAAAEAAESSDGEDWDAVDVSQLELPEQKAARLKVLIRPRVEDCAISDEKLHFCCVHSNLNCRFLQLGESIAGGRRLLAAHARG